jgi:hypothetical protein
MNATARARATTALWIDAPELADVEVRELGRGLDNVAYIAADLVLRVGDAPSGAREAALLTFSRATPANPDSTAPLQRRLRRARPSVAATCGGVASVKT